MSKKVFIVFITSILIACAHQKTEVKQETSSKTAYQLYSSALNHFASELLDSALVEINNAIAINAQLAQFHQLKAEILNKQNNTNEALVAYRKVLSIRSNSPKVMESIAELLEIRGDYLEAAQMLRRVYVQTPENKGLWLKIADLYIKSEQFEIAFHSAEKFRVLHGNENALPAHYYRIRGVVSFHNHVPNEAISFLETALKTTKLNEAENSILLHCYFETEAYYRAYDYLLRLDEESIKKGDRYFFRGWYYFSLKKNKDAQKHFELALENNTGQILVYYYLGKIYLEDGQSEKAQNMFRLFREKADKPQLRDKIDPQLIMDG